MPDFRPRDSLRSPRFAQVATFMRLPQAAGPQGLDVALLGIPFDGGTSYRPGSRFGPREIRTHSALVRPHHPVLQVNPFDVLKVADIGDVDVSPLDIERALRLIDGAVTEILEAGTIPVCVGGDHSLSLGVLRALARKHGPVGMVHVDSHQDMWDEYFGNRYFHGTPFRRAVEEGLLDTRRVVQIGIRGPVYDAGDFDFGRRHGVRTIRIEEVARHGTGWVTEQMLAVRGGPVYLSFDVDGVDPAFAPGTGTPEVGGLTSREAIEIVRGLVGLPLVGADVVEVCPAYDHGNITAVLAATLIFEIVSVLAANRMPPSASGGERQMA